MSEQNRGEPMKIALVGVGGYGGTYVPLLLSDAEQHNFRFVGGVDPFPERAAKIEDLQDAAIPIFPSMDALYTAVTPDLVVLAPPTAPPAVGGRAPAVGLPAPQTPSALARGSHVLCEKPIAATPADAAKMRAARDAAGKLVAIGYQWSFSSAVQALKADALAGAFGKLKRMRTVVLWPRDESYYARNDW